MGVLALQDNSTMLMEASKGGHTMVVKLLMDYPNSISHLTTPVAHPNAVSGDVVSGAVVENCNTNIGVAAAQTSQQLSMGLTVVPNPVLNASNQIILPDVCKYRG